MLRCTALKCSHLSEYIQLFEGLVITSQGGETKHQQLSRERQIMLKVAGSDNRTAEDRSLLKRQKDCQRQRYLRVLKIEAEDTL